MEFAKSSEVRKSGRRSIKDKNLQKVVEAICSQEESDEESNVNMNKSDVCPKTPRASESLLQELHQTPRRSCRKSIKPSQDYDDIVNKSLRSAAKKVLLVTSEEQDENHDSEVVLPKWTPAKVGRVSQKRGRKSKRKGVKQVDKEIKELDEKTICNDNIPNIEIIEEIIEQNEHGQCEKIVENVDNVEHINVTIENKGCQENNERREEDIDKVVNADDHIDNESENTNESAHVILDESGDCVTLSERFEQDDICIIYESNISNKEMKEEIKEEIPSISNKNITSREKVDDSFGCYLKSKEINISDLGLNPIKDEEEEKDMDYKNIQTSQDVEEMPSLIVCDDDSNDNDENNDALSARCNKLNETYEAIDSETVESGSKDTAEVMETLKLSDDEDNAETPRKRIRIVVTDPEMQNISILLNTPKASVPTPKPLATPKFTTTPKQKIKSFRFPTPFRNNKSFKFNNEVKENMRNTPRKHISNLFMNAMTTLEPKEIVLRGIRKRSLSVCIDGNDEKRQQFLEGPLAKGKPERVVSFYSPANETKFTDDLDIIIEKSVKKQKRQEKDLGNKFVTTRRKRSLSLDESTLHSISLISKLPRPVVGQNIIKVQTSSSTSKAALRTKLPNFAAIHQKQFNKMENLVDHVSRKQERSNNLISSTTKLKPASTQKNASVIKNNIPTVKSRAIKKIDLGTVSEVNKSFFNTTIAPIASETKTIGNLANPRIAVVKPINSRTIAQKKPQQQQQQLNKYLKPSQATNIEKPKANFKKVASLKPSFNLSTSLMVKPNANTSQMNCTDKAASRLQRHMDLFKGRGQSPRASKSSRKNEVILKGVRSNRRFELQMQHRKNLEQ